MSFPSAEASRARWCTAYHEAGHAVASHALGRDVDHVTIRTDKAAGFVGRVQGVPPAPDEVLGTENPHLVSRRVQDLILILYAGGAAEEAFSGMYDEAGCSADIEEALDLAFTACGSDPEAFLLLENLAEQARALVGRTWPAIDALVAALLEHEELDGLEVSRIIDEALPVAPAWKVAALEIRLDALYRQVAELPRLLAHNAVSTWKRGEAMRINEDGTSEMNPFTRFIAQQIRPRRRPSSGG